MTRDSLPPPPPPSWPRVIATTLRLWVQRHVIGARPSAPAGGRPYRLVAGVVAIAAVAGSATALVIAKGSDAPSATPASTGEPATGAPSSTLSSQALAAANASRQQAAAWVATQVSHGVIVGCDPLMCAALQQHGFPPADLATLGASASDPLGAGIVMSTLAVRSQLGTSLASVYAPLVIASFGAGSSLVQVRVETPGGAASYVSAGRADLVARQTAGRELAANKNIDAPATARAELVSGRVDSRLLITMAALAARFRLRIDAFGDGGPGDGASAPLRQLAIVTSSATYLHQLLAFLGAQRPPLLAIVSEHRRGRTTTVHVQFTAPSLFGLLPASTTQ
ncbi:MAG TPA: hypothetical protein VGH96_12415 [Streptosporangiaceae bacterium]